MDEIDKIIEHYDVCSAVERISTLEDRIDTLEQALHQIDHWSQAYPQEVFPKPDSEYLAEAAKVLEQNGMSLGRISANTMRHVITGVGKIAREALGRNEPNEQ